MEFRCKNKKCGRLIADVEDESMLPNVLECQHCHHMNIIRRKAPRVKASKKTKPAPKPIEPTPNLEELAPEPEDLSAAASPAFQAAMRDESPGPVSKESAEEGE